MTVEIQAIRTMTIGPNCSAGFPEAPAPRIGSRGWHCIFVVTPVLSGIGVPAFMLFSLPFVTQVCDKDDHSRSLQQMPWLDGESMADCKRKTFKTNH